MSNETLASLYGFLSVMMGFALAAGTWFVGIRFRPSRNKWIHGLRFTLWSVIVLMFYPGGGTLLRSVLGMPGSNFREFLQGLIGIWLLGSFVLFPLGVWLGARRSKALRSVSAV